MSFEFIKLIEIPADGQVQFFMPSLIFSQFPEMVCTPISSSVFTSLAHMKFSIYFLLSLKGFLFSPAYPSEEQQTSVLIILTDGEGVFHYITEQQINIVYPMIPVHKDSPSPSLPQCGAMLQTFLILGHGTLLICFMVIHITLTHYGKQFFQ